ncbi:unnamed protein product, partial [Allacma fusca]
YFELRYNVTVRRTISIISIVYLIFYMAIAVYGPALALSQVTGFSHRYLVAAIFVVCIFYSSLGGLKAVVWTDTLQALIMMASLMVIVIKGASDIGGFSVVWKRAQDTGRTGFLNLDPDPRTRHTFWTSIIGMYFVWLPLYAATQANIQRFAAMPNIQTVRRALLINMIGLYITIGLCFTAGLVIFARYHDCDPVTRKTVDTADQLLPLFVMDVLGEYRGLPGIFVAGITSASLSSVSSGLNALAAIITEDYIKKWVPDISDSRLSTIAKIISVVCGLLSFGFIFAAEQMGNVFSAGISILGMILGPTLGIFTLGMFFPWANARGALLGLFCSLGFIGFIGVGSAIAQNQGLLPDQRLSLSTAGCLNETFFTETSSPDFHSTTPIQFLSQQPELEDTLIIKQLTWKENKDSPLIKFLSVSFIWNSAYGCLSAILFGLLFSLIFSRIRDYPQVHEDYLSPPLLWMWTYAFPKQMKRLVTMSEHHDISLVAKENLQTSLSVNSCVSRF